MSKLFNCGYVHTVSGWLIREGSETGEHVATFRREADADAYVRLNEMHVHLSSGGKPDTPQYTRADVQALIAVALAVPKQRPSNEPKTGQSSGDFDKDLARVNAIRNDLWLDDHASNHDVEFLIGFIDNLWREYSRANEKLSASTPPFSLPPLNADLIDILGRPNFMCAGIATRLRDFGFEIKRKAEHEQAAVAHWCLGLYLQHGDAWEAKANEFLSSSPTKSESRT